MRDISDKSTTSPDDVGPEEAGRALDDHSFAERAARVRWLLFDVDGVLTDGRLWFSAAGETLKAFHVHDGLAIKLAQRAGLKIGLFTGRTSEPLHRRAKELDLDHVISASKDKASDFQAFLDDFSTAADEVAFVGDDLPDMPVMRRCGLAMTPANGAPEVKAAVHWVVPRRGGEGVARAVIERVLESRGAWRPLIDELYGG
ncbi:MAG: HAD-IIIA family hydrolase [Acidobacteriota bacterium]